MCDLSSHASRPAGQPRWGLLYGVAFPPLLALTTVEALAPTAAARTALRYVLALAVIAGMAVWLRASRHNLDLAQWCECASTTVSVRVIESRRPGLPEARPRAVTPEEEHTLVAAGAHPALR
jgi:hypothetical protein